MPYYAKRRTYTRTANRRRTTRYRTQRYAGRKRYNRRNRNSRYRVTNVRIPNTIQPDYTLVRFKDRNGITFPTGTLPAAAGEQSFSYVYITGNDLYDAFSNVATADTVRPTGFMNWMTFYESFIVHKSSIRVTPISTIGSTSKYLPFEMTIVPVTEIITDGIDQITPVEQAYARSRIFSGNLSNRDTSEQATTAGAPGQMVLSNVWNSMMTKKILGIKDLSDDPDVKGANDASPSIRFFYLVYIQSMIPWDGTGTAANLQLDPIVANVDIFYKAQLLDRKTVYDRVDPIPPPSSA
uniref:Capsid protein n=1 Tax=Anser anser CRESS-DNA-virus sp. TaxID=2815022 RepID=A0A8A4XC10_9VIRU|nr:MAG: hypothetical protein [Anser anser CRESS-DNA-virus sp.]